MNERIKELAEQAERLAEDELAHLERVHNRLYSFTEGREIYNQKFAELIIGECADLFKNVLISVETEHGHQSVMASKFIRNHFGLEK